MQDKINFQQILQLGTAGIKDLEVLSLRASKLIKFHITVTFSLHGETEREVFEVVIDEGHPDYSVLVRESPGTEIEQDMEKVLMVKTIASQVEDKLVSFLKEKYRSSY